MAYLVRQELCDVRMLRYNSSLANYVVDPLGKQLLQMSVVCDYGNSHRVRPRVVGDESPLTPQGLCELSLPLEQEGFDWGQAQFAWKTQGHHEFHTAPISLVSCLVAIRLKLVAKSRR